jgi:DNA primase
MSNDNFTALKARIRLSDHVRLKVKLVRKGPDWFGCCPFHHEKSASFTVNDAKGFFHCFGCEAHGDILDWWQKGEGLSFNEARDRLRNEAGAAPIGGEPKPVSRSEPDEDTRRKQREGRAIWKAAMPISGTIAETYLRGPRCIRLEELPSTLRFHPGLQPDSRTAETLPAMIAAITNGSGEVVAIQRTFLAPDGSGKAAISAPKRSLGPIGLGCVKLGASSSILGVAEGVETGLSAMELFRVPVWCPLGSNLARIELPQPVRHVVIFGDRGRAGEDAAAKARRTYKVEGRKVAVRFPEIGDDFNDELRARRNEG